MLSNEYLWRVGEKPNFFGLHPEGRRFEPVTAHQNNSAVIDNT